MRKFWISILSFFSFYISQAQTATKPTEAVLIKAAKIFDGENMRENVWVLVKDNVIVEVGAPQSFAVPAQARIVDLKEKMLLPGLIEGHSHLFLHPYNETKWDDQVLKESRAERTARAVNHARNTLLAGFTTVRDLGTEGAQYDDVGLKKAIEKGVVPGPRMIVATRAIVATGAYGPQSAVADQEVIRGAAEADGEAALIHEARLQMGKGADLIKVYADYRWGTGHDPMPTFTEQELTRLVQVVNSSGRQVVAHASTVEGMRRAVMAGVHTIEHGDAGTGEIFKLMKEKAVAYCPTLAATESVLQYRGWKKGVDAEPAEVTQKKKSFTAALQSGVTICMGGDVGVFTHGENWREMELMVEYGMKTIDVLRSATSVNADVFEMGDKIGRIRKGLFADLIAVEGNPASDIRVLRKVAWVMKDGVIVKE